MKSIKVLVTAVLVSMLVGCAREKSTQIGHEAASAEVAEKQASTARSQQQAAGETPEFSRTRVSADTDAALTQEVPQPIDRKIIRNANLTIETEDPAAVQQKIGAIADSQGGYVVTSDFKTTGSQQSGVTVNVIMRVPSRTFEAALTAVRGIGGRVIEENVSGKDVTEEYIDLEARIRTKKALEGQFLEIMKQARKVSEALEVQSQIADVRTEIERLEGRRRFLENQSSLSTISVTLKTPAPVVTATTTSFGHSIKEAFGESVDLAASIVLGVIRIVIVMVPIIILVFLPIGFTIRYLVRKYSPKKRTPVAEAN